MSKSQKTNTNHNHQSRLALALVAGGLVAGCSGNDPWTVDPDGFDGIAEESFPLLANSCVINSVAGTMAISVRGGETTYLTLRAADSKVIADGTTAGSAECAVPSTYKISITEDNLNPGIEKVFLDYINGTYSLGATAGSVVTPGITLALGAGSSVIVRGSIGVDKVYLGSTYSAPSVLQYSWINVSGDTSPDIRMTGVTDVKVSTGIGADIISGDGGQGTGSALDVSITLSVYGGPDADTLTGGKGASLLDGGDGDDKFVQSATIGADTIVGGKGSDTVDYSVRTTAVNVTVCTVCSTDPSGCIAANTTCRATATTAKGTCDGLANTGKTTCDGLANTAKTTCDGSAASAKTTCDGNANTAKTTCDSGANTAETTCNTNAGTAKTTCDTAADDAQTTCTAACGGVQGCIDACDATHVTDLATCDSTHTSDVATCTSNHTTTLANCASTQTGALATCTSNQTASLATCTSNQTASLATCTTTQTNALTVCTTTLAGANSACDATEVTCQGGAVVAACVVCTGDDGTGAEGDTVNDDVEVVLGSKGNDAISATWAVCSDQAATPVIKCTLKGNEGDDTLVGSSHNDTIDGGAGNDVMQGGLGDDTFVGGAGVDTVSYADRSTLVKVSLDSTKLWVSGQNGASGELDVIPSDVENLTGGSGNDLLRGNASANIIHGGAGNDTIEGALGNDSLYGDVGNDLLYGGAGNDMLVGGAGTDTLIGGDGDDFLDASDAPAASDTAIDCDGVNDSALTAGTAPGTADALVKDSGIGIDTGALRCELQ